MEWCTIEFMGTTANQPEYCSDCGVELISNFKDDIQAEINYRENFKQTWQKLERIPVCDNCFADRSNTETPQEWKAREGWKYE